MTTNVSGDYQVSPTDTAADVSPVNQFVSAVTRLAESVDAPEAVVDDLVESGEKVVDYVDELEKQVEDVEESTDEVDERVDDLEERADETEDTVDSHERKLEHHLGDICRLESEIEDVEDELEDITPAPSTDETTPLADLTPIERLSQLPEDELEDEPKKVQRAVTLFENLPAWGQKTAKGIVLKSEDNARSLLSAARDESLRWKQVHRAYEALDDLAKDAVEYHDDHPRHGKMVVLKETSVDVARCQPSSAGT